MSSAPFEWVQAKVLQQVGRAYREGGPSLVARKAASALCVDVLLHAFDLDRDLPGVASELSLEVRALTPDDVPAYLALREDEDAPTVQARLRRGDLCYAAWNGDDVIAGVWVRFDRMWVSEFGRSIPLQDGEVYGYAAFTDPRHRGRGTAPVLYEATLRHLADVGHRRAVAYVLRENCPGRAALDKLRFAYTGRVRWFHLGRVGLELTTRKGRRPRLRLHVRPRHAHE